ncbi:hypothetical protein GYB22_08895 [bacterium]|nr:hypothetical protein [bacterium]
MDKKLILNGVVGLLVLLAVQLHRFILPIGELDGVWTFSQAYSAIEGSLFFNFYTNQVASTAYGLIPSPLLFLVNTEQVVNLFYVLIAIISLILLVRMFKNHSLAILVIITLISDKVLGLHRSEALFILLGLWYLILLNNKKEPNKWLSIGAFVVLFFIHPVDAVLLAFSILCIKQKLWVLEPSKTYIVLSLGFIIALVSFYFIPIENLYLDYFRNRINTWSLDIPQTYIMFGGASTLLLILLNRKQNPVFWFNLMIFTVVISIFGAYYYYLFLWIPLLQGILNRPFKSEAFHKWLYLLFIFNFGINALHPLNTVRENFEYVEQTKSIQEYLRIYQENHLFESPENKVFIENYFAISMLQHDPSKRTRMVLLDGGHEYFYDSLTSGDHVFCTYAGKQKTLESLIRSKGQDFNRFEIKKPVQGLLSLQSRYQTRTDSLGLWLYEIK